ncbi:MAG: bifunctional 3-(3-hydroxy-phenyl)propionate/3-hydroxycinnamic acid hydroxylase [Gammaproteobacteria bacterium]|nr:bifunctional 3-(3-hydroxy-phenyl)propionate/3-hydroxycinnamic acid hydroxylase [Gammaproteobacteria bacterium]
MSNAGFDVAILGLGPVGSTAAILFAHAGLKVVAFERDEEVYKLPRAVNLDGEIVRAFQRIGLGDEVANLLQPVREGDRVGFANSKREWLFGRDSAAFGSNGWQPGNMFDQPELESYLRRTAIAHDNVTAYIGFEVNGFVDDGDSITINADEADGTRTQTVTARYLVGCDGASSFVRKTLDIEWVDLGYDHDWLVVDIVTKPGHTLTNVTLQVCDPERLCTYVCTKDPYRRWEFKLNTGESWEEMLEPERIHSLIDPWTPRDTYDIRRAAVYQFHAATAETWHVGNVFIAGDAAHQTPPFLGQGMNAGMRDVVNLAWKFQMVLSGVANDALLDTYQAEREAHANDLVDWAVAIGQLMEHTAAVEAAERAGTPPPAIPPQHQASGYGQGREQPPIRDGVVKLDQVSDTGSTGYLFSQPIVRDRQNDEFRLDARLGPGFAIVAKTEADLVLSAASQATLDRIQGRCTSIGGLQEVRGHIDRLFNHADAAIVRPDRYVFGHTTDDVTLDDLMADLADKLSIIGDTQ